MSSLFAAVSRCLIAPPCTLEDGSREGSFVFPPDFLGFQGHFPEKPILPGIAQIMAALLTAGYENEVRLCGVKRAKFMSMMSPGQTMRVKTSLKKDTAGLVLTAECTNETGPCAQLKLIVEPVLP